MNFAVDEATAIVEAACESFKVLGQKDIPESSRDKAIGQLLTALPYLDHLKYQYPEERFPFHLYRVRSQNGIGEEESVNQIKTFSYPSPQKCKTARANKEGCPVFYVADNPGTALKEAGCEQGEEVYVSEWQVTKAEKAGLFLFFDHALPAEHPWEKIRAGQEKQFNQSLAAAPEPIRKKWTQLHTAICKAFLGKDYQISSLIGHQLLHAHKESHVQLLVYPSTVEGEKYCNLAIHPQFADTHLQMGRIWKIRITDEAFKTRPEVLQTGYISGETISWHMPDSQEGQNVPI